MKTVDSLWSELVEKYGSDRALEIVAEAQQMLTDSRQNKPLVEGRGDWGDKHPCIVCGNYGFTTLSFCNGAVCKEHSEWYKAERNRVAESRDKRICPQCGQFADKHKVCWNCGNDEGVIP